MGQAKYSCTPLTNYQLGAAGQTTTLSGGATYGGTCRVLGDLVLTNGNYVLQNATFYVDGQAGKYPIVTGGYQRVVTGSTITVGANATLTLDNSTLTAAGGSTSCPMWRGLVLDHQEQGPSGTYRLIVQNNSTISHALCGLTVADISNVSPGSYTGTSNYLLDHATFANNLTHVSDETDHPGTQPSLITSCTFRSDPTQMHFPYDENPATGDKYYTYEALRLLPRGIAQTPLGNMPANAIEVRNNTIDQAVYGIVNNQFDKAAVLIAGNYLNKIFQTGIWTINSYSNQGTSQPVVSNNRIGINAYPPQNTDQIDPAATVFGIVGEDPYQPNAFVGNQITGDKNNGPKPQVGMSLQQQASASGNVLENLNAGIQTWALNGSDIFDNRLSDCDDAFVVLPNDGHLYWLNWLGCNTFSQSGPAPASRGIVVPLNATINDIGDFSNPAANKFVGLGVDIYNDGSPFTYYRTSSTQEPASTGGFSNTSIQTVFLPRRSLVNYCLNQGAGNGNGVNNFRVAAPSASYIAALMDSVRRQLVPAARSRDYLHEVLSYHAGAQQLPALETWWTTLSVPNAAAYRTVGRYLLRAYDAKPATAGAAQRVLAALQPAALLNAELAAQLKLRAVLRHLPQTTPRLAAADSVALRTLAWSGTSVAAPAGRWLRYYHPRIALPTVVPAPTLRLAAQRKTVLTESGTTLGAAYPNPAQTEVTITCRLAQAEQAAELHFTNLLTGKTALVVPVAGTGTERRQRVALAGLPAGQYAYQLVVEGQLVAAPQKLMVNP